MISIQIITAFEDFHQTLNEVYRLESIRFRSGAGIEYRIAFLSFNISDCQDIIHKLKSEDLIEDFVEINENEFLEKIDHKVFHQPISMMNYIVYAISQGRTTLVKDDKGFQRKMKSLDFETLPKVIYKRDGKYKIRFPERFIQSLQLQNKKTEE